jgi:putative endonuclease
MNQSFHKSESQHFIYILQSRDGRFYTGYTTDLQRRLKQHQQGVGAKFTRGFGALDILYHEICADKSTALKREAQIKKLTRSQKEALIKGSLVKIF